MKTKKIYVVGSQSGYARWIENAELIEHTTEYTWGPDLELEKHIAEADIVLFTGGEDVNPELYGHEALPETYFTKSRDAYEVKAWKCIRPDQCVVGICRGLQLINVLYGGILVQDVNDHALGYTHEMHNSSYTYEITSLHHQMVYPWTIDKDKFDILYWTNPRSCGYYAGFDINKDYFYEYGEPEVVLYHSDDLPTALGIQGHPEMMQKSSPTVKMLNNLVNQILKDNNNNNN